MHKAFLRAANLKRWLSKAANRSEGIKRCKALFDKIYGAKSCDRHHEELALADEDYVKKEEDKATPDDLKALVASPHVALHARFRSGGIVYARASTHKGNSLVLFYPDGNIDSPPIPGCIQHIFSVGGKTSFAIQRYRKSASNNLDPFARWPEFRAQTWSTTQGSHSLEIVQISWIHAHFAQLSIGQDKVVVLDLREM
ncbi:hypothetical protein GSI_07182 [Ganoderma sinense ZZ0214-1]|uniref:Uncharacterized protein n=1 Tax=Ganoderma sinense ZZ0214-1 TaxID=1077348 RepID=A0A2G8S9P6_9APHY|nr:hypothetical protein GSI_07182 [Ganoderma sinense ZZ0214-1]